MILNFQNIACLAIATVLAICTSDDYVATPLTGMEEAHGYVNTDTAPTSFASKRNAGENESQLSDQSQSYQPLAASRWKELLADSDFKVTLLFLASLYYLAVALRSNAFKWSAAETSCCTSQPCQAASTLSHPTASHVS